MTGDPHGRTAGKATLLVRAMDEILGTHRLATSNHEDMHAGELETSILLHAHPELVRDGYQAADWTVDDRPHLLTTEMGEYTHNGVIGRPSLASAEKGKAVLSSLVDRFASVLEVLQR
jgi:creatinine amidohydrolase